MQIETFDLSVDRSAKPQVSQMPRAERARFAQVLRCDTPASIHVDSSAADPVPAIPGTVFDSFDRLWISNETGKGRLVIAYYTQAVSTASQGRFPYSMNLGTDLAVATVAEILITPPPNGTVILDGLTFGYSAAPSTLGNIITVVERRPGGPGGTTLWQDVTPQSIECLSFHRPFPKGLIVAQGMEARISFASGGAGIIGIVSATGVILN